MDAIAFFISSNALSESEDSLGSKIEAMQEAVVVGVKS